MVMEMHHILETLNKVDSTEGKIRFLEKCLFEEKKESVRSKVLALLRKLKKKRTSFEDLHITHLEKETRESIVEEILIQTKEKEIKKEESKREGSAKLETIVEPNSAIERAAEESALIKEAKNLEGPVIIAKDYILGDKNGAIMQDYKPGSGGQKDYHPQTQQEQIIGNYMPRTDLSKDPFEAELPEEEYKSMKILKVGAEAEMKEEKYKRKLTQGLV